jgi:hypothetical protein
MTQQHGDALHQHLTGTTQLRHRRQRARKIVLNSDAMLHPVTKGQLSGRGAQFGK